MKYLLFAGLVLMTSCGKKGSDGSNGNDGVTTVVEVPAPPIVLPEPSAPTPDELELEAIQAVVNDENDYRLGLGQTMLSKGLSCTLQSFTSGDRIQASIAGHNTLAGKVTVGTYLLQRDINQPDASVNDGLNILPDAFKMTYLNMFYLSCTGYIAVTETGYKNFELSSDDAGLLYIAGSKLIDLDNSHGIQTLAAPKFLRRGVHAITIQFAQSGGGNQALILKLNGSILSNKLFVH